MCNQNQYKTLLTKTVPMYTSSCTNTADLAMYMMACTVHNDMCIDTFVSM